MVGVRFFLDRTAAAAAEIALMLPMLIILMFGGLEASYYFWNEHKVVKAVRDGARYAGRAPFAAFDCATGSMTTQELKAGLTYENAIKNTIRTSTIDGTGPVLIPGWTNSQITLAVTCGNTASGGSTQTGIFRDLATGAPRVRVVANVSYQPLFSTLGFSTVNLGLQASSEAVVMGL